MSLTLIVIKEQRIRKPTRTIKIKPWSTKAVKNTDGLIITLIDLKEQEIKQHTHPPWTIKATI